MTAKEALREYVDGLSEDDAAELLLLIEGRERAAELSAEDMAKIVAGRADIEEGRFHGHASVLADARTLTNERLVPPSMTAEQSDRVRRSLEQLDEGRGIDQGTVEAFFGVDRCLVRAGEYDESHTSTAQCGTLNIELRTYVAVEPVVTPMLPPPRCPESPDEAFPTFDVSERVPVRLNTFSGRTEP